MASILRKLFRRKKQPPLVCAVNLDADGNPVGEHPDHVHTDACFINFEPLAIAELFQSQSCQSCPPALPGIHAATADPNVLLLSYPVTLFDHTGWKDTFSSLTNDARQRAYAKRWNRTSLFTPQVIVNGVADGSGRTKEEIQQIIQQGRDIQKARDWHIYIDANDTEVRVDTDKQEANPHEVALVVYANTDQTVKVGKGVNKGKKINHRNVVTSVTKIGDWVGGNATWYLPSPRSALAPDQGAAIIITDGGLGGPIVAAAKI
ncbi:thioredoxin-like protein [Trichoderma pleuroticola]